MAEAIHEIGGKYAVERRIADIGSICSKSTKKKKGGHGPPLE
jgi:hypothetical protein